MGLPFLQALKVIKGNLKMDVLLEFPQIKEKVWKCFWKGQNKKFIYISRTVFCTCKTDRQAGLKMTSDTIQLLILVKNCRIVNLTQGRQTVAYQRQRMQREYAIQQIHNITN